MRSQLLRDADPSWVMRIKLGCAWFRAGVAFKVIAWAIHATWGKILLAPFGSALMVAGAWLFTIPDPSGLGEQKHYSLLRNWARTAAIVNFPVSLTTAFAIPLLSQFLWYPEVQLTIASISAILLMLYLIGMTPRLERVHVASSMRSLMLLYIGAAVFVSLCHLPRTGMLNFLRPFRMLLTGINSIVELFYFYFLFQPISTFYIALKEEAAAAVHPAGNPLWRSAGSFLYSARQLLRRKNGTDH